jgi:hypothetical protein
MQEDCVGRSGPIVVDMMAIYELLLQCDVLACPAASETKKQCIARKLRLQKKKQEIRGMLPLYKVVWFAHYRVHGVVPDA